jgi:hypothetical protein
VALQLHHVYVCTSPDAPEAVGLVAAGLVEGSPNTHPGQGTSNRRFFFERGFLELLWVHDEREAQAAPATPVTLWDRWAGRGRTSNPFGLCFSSADGAGPNLPFPCVEYRPDYLSDGRHFLFADGLSLSEPELFVLSWPQVPSPPSNEPVMHPLGLREMRSVSLGLADTAAISRSLRAISDAGLVRLHYSAKPEMVIEFTASEVVHRSFPALGLTIIGARR